MLTNNQLDEIKTTPTSTPTITPFLWFESQAQEAAKFYVSIFPYSKLITDSPFICEIELQGQKFSLLNGGAYDKFNDSISWVISTESQEETDYYWNKFIDNGGKPKRCGWLTDKFGMTWQVVPKRLAELMTDPNPAKSDKVRAAMMKMVKIDIKGLEKAYNEG